MGKQFDELAKALASGVSRRSALKRFAAGAAGAALASVFTGRSADAQITPAICQECLPPVREIVFRDGNSDSVSQTARVASAQGGTPSV